MTATSLRRLLGLAAIAAGLVLVVALPGLELAWFQGRPFGGLLVLLGLVELLEQGWSRRRGGRDRR